MRRLLTLIAGVLVAGAVQAQTNTTANTSAPVQWGQRVLSFVNSNTTQFFFFVRVEPGQRSYCVETAQPQSGSFGDKNLNTVLAVLDLNSQAVVAANDNAELEEPRATFLSRVCWIPVSNGFSANYVRLTGVFGHPPSNVELRFVETTMFCPWFFIAGDYNAFSLIRNTSNSVLDGVVVTWRGLNGMKAGTTTVSIPANGTVILNARDFVDPASFSNGSIEIIHTGSPQQLMGSTTTLSGTTGLGFDAVFSQRQPW